jgi:2-methylcitrate dehydratase PrpD
VVRTIGQPIEKKRVPETAYEAQFSGPYAVATGLLGGAPLGSDGLAFSQADWTAELARDPARRALMALVDVVGDPRCDGIFPNQFPAILRVRTRDGREWTEEVLTNLGGPRRPLTDAQLSAKFRANAAAVLTDGEAARVEEEVHRLDEAADVRRLLSLTVPAA